MSLPRLFGSALASLVGVASLALPVPGHYVAPTHAQSGCLLISKFPTPKCYDACVPPNPSCIGSAFAEELPDGETVYFCAECDVDECRTLAVKPADAEQHPYLLCVAASCGRPCVVEALGGGWTCRCGE